MTLAILILRSGMKKKENKMTFQEKPFQVGDLIKHKNKEITPVGIVVKIYGNIIKVMWMGKDLETIHNNTGPLTKMWMTTEKDKRTSFVSRDSIYKLCR